MSIVGNTICDREWKVTWAITIVFGKKFLANQCATENYYRGLLWCCYYSNLFTEDIMMMITLYLLDRGQVEEG